MLMPDRPLEPSKMIALGFAFGAACAELGIGDGSLDVAKPERLTHILLGFVRKGEYCTLPRCIGARSFTSEIRLSLAADGDGP